MDACDGAEVCAKIQVVCLCLVWYQYQLLEEICKKGIPVPSHAAGKKLHMKERNALCNVWTRKARTWKSFKRGILSDMTMRLAVLAMI